MKNICYIILPLLVLATSCKNKELAMEDPCFEMGWSVLVRMNWDNHERDSRQMRMSLFSQNEYPTLDRETVDKSGEKSIKLPVGCSYLPITYDYYAKNIYFRNENDCDKIEAYSVPSTRATYDTRATPVDGETTVSEPGSFHMHAWDETFDITHTPADGEQLFIDFYPKNVLREFTFRINNVVGAKNIAQARGAISGMAASMYLSTGLLNTQRSTILFENVSTTNEEIGSITGHFYTFGPIEPYSNRFTIEVISRLNVYNTAYWDVSDQITESMANRAAKLARDGYDILLNSTLPTNPEIEEPGDNSGFEIDIREWNDVVIYL